MHIDIFLVVDDMYKESRCKLIHLWSLTTDKYFLNKVGKVSKNAQFTNHKQFREWEYNSLCISNRIHIWFWGKLGQIDSFVNLLCRLHTKTLDVHETHYSISWFGLHLYGMRSISYILASQQDGAGFDSGCADLARSPCVRVGSLHILQLPPTVLKHANWG